MAAYLWLVFAFGSAFFAGLTAILAKIGIKDIDSNVATAVRTIVILIFSWVMVYVTGVRVSVGSISEHTLLFLILSGLSTGASWLCYFKALQLGDVNKVAPVDKSSTVLTMLFAFIFLGEHVGMMNIIGMTAIGVGTLMMITRKSSTGYRKKTSKAWIFYAVGSAVFASLTAILGKIGIQDIDSTLGTAIRTCVVLVMAWFIVFITKKQGQVSRIGGKNMVFLILSGVTTGLSWLSYYKALQDGPASVVVPVDKMSILVTILFSYIFLREKLSVKAVIGLMLIVVGTLLMVLWA